MNAIPPQAPNGVPLLHYMTGKLATCQSHALARKLQSVNEQFLTNMNESGAHRIDAQLRIKWQVRP